MPFSVIGNPDESIFKLFSPLPPRQFSVETERLRLIPLTPRQMNLWTENLPALERELDCRYRAEALNGIFLEIAKAQASAAAADEKNYLFHSFWLLLRKTDRTVVGSVVFKGPPAAGAVEIGYGLGKEFEHNGYMAEAVRAACDWAAAQPGVKRVTAETDADNPPSHNVLKRCGFTLASEGETFWWERC